jgi:hypothetical protein
MPIHREPRELLAGFTAMLLIHRREIDLTRYPVERAVTVPELVRDEPGLAACYAAAAAQGPGVSGERTGYPPRL